MDRYNKIDVNSSLVFLPDYTVKAFKNAGITLEEIAMLGKNYNYDNNSSIENEKYNILKEKIKKRMAVSDIAEIYTINNFLYRNLFKFDWKEQSCLTGTLAFIKSISCLLTFISDIKQYENEIISDFINNYKNLNIDVNSILMSGNTENKVYSFETYENTVFVIIHDGFANLVLNTTETKYIASKFFIKTMDYMFKSLGEDVVFNSSLFHTFISLHR